MTSFQFVSKTNQPFDIESCQTFPDTIFYKRQIISTIENYAITFDRERRNLSVAINLCTITCLPSFMEGGTEIMAIIQTYNETSTVLLISGEGGGSSNSLRNGHGEARNGDLSARPDR